MEGFIANLYELFRVADLGNFSTDMYNNGFYLPIFIIMVAAIILVACVYYYLVNHPRANRWYHWLFFNLGTGAANFIVTWVVSHNKIEAFYAAQGMYSPHDWTNYLILSLIAVLWSVIFFFLFSFIIKWGSRNCKHTPFL
jgi:hypothetical protein